MSTLGMKAGRPQQLESAIFGANLPGMVCMWLAIVMPAMAFLFLLLRGPAHVGPVLTGVAGPVSPSGAGVGWLPAQDGVGEWW